MPDPVQLDAVPAHYRGTDHLKDMVHSKQLSEEQKIKEAATQFEAIMLRQILKDSMKPMFNGFLQGDTPGKDIYQQMMIEGLADTLARSKALGLADELSRQITPMVLQDGSVNATGKPLKAMSDDSLDPVSLQGTQGAQETTSSASNSGTIANSLEMPTDIRQTLRPPFK